MNLDLSYYISGLRREHKTEFLTLHREFLDSLRPDDLADYSLTPEELAKLLAALQ